MLIIIALFLLSCTGDFKETDDNLPAIRIVVLNGCGFSGAAAEMRDYLIRYNIDVIDVGNADRYVYDKSIIVVKKDDEQDLERLMRYSKIKRRTYALNKDSEEAFQIIVGKDYLQYTR